jgi:curli biogenesis system outer membrane secretion channel CsgG
MQRTFLLALLTAASVATACGGSSPRGAASAEEPELGDSEPGAQFQPTSSSREGWQESVSKMAQTLGERLQWSPAKMKIAVLDFSTPEGSACELSGPLAEDLTTHLFSVDRFSIIERRMLNKVLAETKASQSDFFDPEAVARLGRLMGADGVVAGTITAGANDYSLNARIIVVESALVASVAQVGLPRAIAEQRGSCRSGAVAAPERPQGPGPGGNAPSAKSAKTFWSVSFDRVPDGLVPDGWNASDRVLVTGSSRSRALQLTSASGQGSVLIDGVQFPSDFRVELVVSLQPWARFGFQAGDLVASTAGEFMGENFQRVPTDGNKHVVLLERRGAVLKMFVDGQEHKIVRRNQMSIGETVRLTLHEGAALYSIKGMAL